jgi:hypothetical protein
LGQTAPGRASRCVQKTSKSSKGMWVGVSVVLCSLTIVGLQVECQGSGLQDSKLETQVSQLVFLNTLSSAFKQACMHVSIGSIGSSARA